MANEEYVACLRRSIQEWNRWREEHRCIRPDLSGANLSDANLSWANLSFANLRRAYLNRANLRGADLGSADLSKAEFGSAYLNSTILNNANLSKADLINATLCGAILSGADLSGANLRGADLREANLSEAILSETNLSKADFHNIIFSHTVFDSLNLSEVKGLETARHYGPSIVNIVSITLPYNEQARLPFLRGAGFSDTLIEYLPSLLTIPIQYHSVFISYSHKDEILAQQLHHDLQDQGIRCWFAPHNLMPGDYYHKHIDKAIQSHDKLLLLLSKHSVESAWVEHEVMEALGREKRERREILFPLRLDDVVMQANEDWAQSLRDTRHIGDFTNWQEPKKYEQAFQEVVRHLKVKIRPTNINGSI